MINQIYFAHTVIVSRDARVKNHIFIDERTIFREMKDQLRQGVLVALDRIPVYFHFRGGGGLNWR